MNFTYLRKHIYINQYEHFITSGIWHSLGDEKLPHILWIFLMLTEQSGTYQIHSLSKQS